MSTPNITANDILHACATGQFVLLDYPTKYGFLGATPGALICQDLKGYIVILCQEEDNPFQVHVEAYCECCANNAWSLEASGWEQL